MKISIGADHRGYVLKKYLMNVFCQVMWLDCGTNSSERCDYPVFARAVCESLREGRAERGVLLCGSGGGMVIAANRNKGMYATLCWDVESALIARADDGSNILVIPADRCGQGEVILIFETWLKTPFKGGVYQERLFMIDKIEEEL